MKTAEVDKKVFDFIKEYGIKEISCAALSEAAEKLGYTVILFQPLHNNANVARLINALNLDGELLKSRGFTYSHGEFRLVFVNESLSEKEKTIVLSHELGHIVLGHAGRAPVIGHDVQEEFEANEFSSLLLKCDSVLFAFFKRNKTILIVIATVLLFLLLVSMLLSDFLLVISSVLLSKTPSSPASEENEPPTAITETSEQSGGSELSAENFEDSGLYFQIKTILDANLSTVSPSVSYDAENHLINVVCIPPSGTRYALMRDKSSIKESWDTLTQSLTGMSDETYKLCLENGYKVGCIVMLVGDDDPDICLFAALNGTQYCNIGKE